MRSVDSFFYMRLGSEGFGGKEMRCVSLGWMSLSSVITFSFLSVPFQQCCMSSPWCCTKIFPSCSSADSFPRFALCAECLPVPASSFSSSCPSDMGVLWHTYRAPSALSAYRGGFVSHIAGEVNSPPFSEPCYHSYNVSPSLLPPLLSHLSPRCLKFIPGWYSCFLVVSVFTRPSQAMHVYTNHLIILSLDLYTQVYDWITHCHWHIRYIVVSFFFQSFLLITHLPSYSCCGQVWSCHYQALLPSVTFWDLEGKG